MSSSNSGSSISHSQVQNSGSGSTATAGSTSDSSEVLELPPHGGQVALPDDVAHRGRVHSATSFGRGATLVRRREYRPHPLQRELGVASVGVCRAHER